MALTGHQEAMELLLIEEADAWFEYLETTRAQSKGRYAAPPRDPGTPGQAPPGRGSRLTRPRSTA